MNALIEEVARSMGELGVKVETLPSPEGKHQRIVLCAGKAQYDFDLEIRRRITRADAVLLASKQEAAGHERLILAGTIHPAAAQMLLQHGVNFADAAGNAHIEQGSLFVHIEGRKRKKLSNTQTGPVRAFHGEGLRLIFVLLLRPGLVSQPYRDLARLSGVSHGVVQYTMNDLERLGFLVRISRTRRRLLNVSELLDRWAVGYAEHLRPKQVLGHFRFAEPERQASWQDLMLDPAGERWGGESAAALYTRHLKPGQLTLYTRAPRGELMKRLRLLPARDGRVEVLSSFWSRALEEWLPDRFAGTAVPLELAYADLLAVDDPRTAEVAAQLRHKMLEQANHG